MPASFGPELIAFFRELSDNNDRPWFEANKARYEADVKAPALRFIEDFAPLLAQISPHYLAIPKAQGGSLFRIYRDVRFSKDKRPYQTHLGIQFRHEATGGDVHAPGFYLHIQPGESGVGMGAWMPASAPLAAIRGAIASHPDDWTAVLEANKAAGLAFMNPESALVKVPRAFAADHVHADSLRMKGFAVFRKLADAEVMAPGFLGDFAAICASGTPLMSFLCQALEQPF